MMRLCLIKQKKRHTHTQITVGITPESREQKTEEGIGTLALLMVMTTSHRWF